MRAVKNAFCILLVLVSPVEGAALKPESLLAGAEGAEVLSGLGNHVGAEL